MPDDMRRDRWLLPVLGRTIVVAGLAGSVVDVYLLGDRVLALRETAVLGYVLLVVGIGLDIIGRLTLGKSYSETVRIRPDHKLITHGIYRFIRHPIYLGVVLFAFAAPLIIGSLVGLIIMTALVPLLINRIRLEERAMAVEFGQEYAEYARKTKKLVPYVY